jgi:DNA repair protein RecN (Recombination protein N)
MLLELRIENFAIIDKVEIHFDPGLIIFTGETGAGKSILIDAVDTMLGGRADSTFVRSGADRAIIEGVFKIPSSTNGSIQAILEREELLDDENYLTLGREIRLNGPNIARVNGRSVTASLLRKIGSYLIDVHGQSEHLSLLRVNQHIILLDRYAEVGSFFETYRNTYHQLQSVRRELAELRLAEQDAARRIDTLTYQINEIESARLQTGEEAELQAERNRLANAEGIASLVQEALFALDDGSPETPSATDLLGQVSHSLKNLIRLDQSQSALNIQAQAIFDNLVELTNELRLYSEKVEFNPKRLDQVEDRLNLIHNLIRKYGGSIEAVLEYADHARQQLEAINNADERIQNLENEETELLHQLGVQGLALSKKRHQEAEKLESALEAELDDLQMSHTRFKVDFRRRPDPDGVPLDNGEKVAFDQSGIEQVEFLIAPNPGEGFKPLAKIASGGETSRLMLALKNVLVSADNIPTLIFDEIDQGIGGRIGKVVGQKLWEVAKQHQVFCVTHLPQLAAYGAQHFHVEKTIQEGRTITGVQQLDGDQRLYELSQMLGGVSKGTMQSAQEILQAVGKVES